ncbi:MAG: DHH family phosphoesterase [Clostridium sp.]|nr:DHH family phosphoesterase [Prevotella sp.]MCM1428196.1 DHH family phosphoesterase [Clostridium sp.]MCM1475927.1 DHH family phosphoesterase [Muribaculaceae bacterium]
MKKFIDNADAEAFIRLIDNASRIVLTCHVRPDGDAVGSSLGLALLLNGLGKSVNVVVPDRPPKNLSFLKGFKDIVVFTQYDPYCSRLVSEADLIICCDFNKPSRQDLLAPIIQGATCPKVLIDHHLDPDDFADLTFSFPDMSSTCELAVRIVAACGMFSYVDKEIASAFLTGMVTDTRNFSVNCKNPDIYEILERLMERGADKELIVKLAMMTRSLASLKLHAYALNQKLEIFDRHHGAVITIDKNELDRFHYERGDTEGLVNAPLEVKGMAYSFFLREDADCIKVSARSCFGFPVNKMCEDLFNGGGHLQASGGEFKGSLENCRRILVEAMPKYDRYLPPNIDKIEKFD